MASAQIFTDGNFQGVGTDGLVVPNGKLYIYDNATGLLATTYQDSAQTITNVNPVILSASGKAKVFLAAGTYDITLKTSADTVVWTLNDYTVDDVYSKAESDAILSARTVGTIAALRTTVYSGQPFISVTGYYTASDNIGVREYYWDAASTEADNGGTIIQVTGVVTGRWKMKVDGEVNVNWFGINTPDTAIANAFAVSKKVVITDNLTFTQPITIPSYGTLSGGNGSSFLPIGTNSRTIVSSAADSIILSEGACIEGFKIQNVVGNGIKLVEGRQSTIRNCSVRGLTVSGQKGLYTLDSGSWDFKVENTWFTKLDKGVELSNSYGTFVNCMITDNNTNLHLNNGHYSFIGGAIAHSIVADCVAGDDFTGDFYSDYNCKVALTSVHLEANSNSTHTKFSIGSLSGDISDRVSLVLDGGCYIANNTSNAVWFDILSGTGTKIDIQTITGVDATYLLEVVKIRDTASNVDVSQFTTYPTDKTLKVSYTAGRTGINYNLKNYLEGKYTPVVSGGSSAGVGTYNGQSGSYIIIGNMVTVNFFVSMTAHTGTGDMRISLPFTSAPSSVGAEYYMGTVMTDNITLGTGSPSLRITANTNFAIIKMSNTAGASTTVAIDGTGYLIGTVSYQIS